MFQEHTELQASIENSLALKPTVAEERIKKFCVLVHDWGEIRSFSYDDISAAQDKFNRFRWIGRLAVQLRDSGHQIELYLGNKNVKKDFDNWWRHNVGQMSLEAPPAQQIQQGVQQ